jgi:hypothetical protein
MKMKKIMFMMLAVLFIWVGVASSDTISVSSFFHKPVKNDNSELLYLYVMPSVAGETTQVFEINSDAKTGDILELSIRYPDSDDYEIWVSETESDADDPAKSIIKYSVNTFYFKPALARTAYINRSEPATNKLWVTIKNNSLVAMGVGELRKLYWRN